MSNESEAAYEIRRLANQYKSMVALADIVEQLGSVKGATKEAEAARAVAEKAVTQANNDLVDVQNKLKETKAQAERIVLEAGEKSSAAAAAALDAARSSAHALITRAESKAAAVEEASARAQSNAAAEIQNMNDDFVVMRKKLAELTDAATAKQSEVDELKADIDALRAKFSQS